MDSTTSPPSDGHSLATRLAALLFVGAAALMVWPLWQPLVLASWFAVLAKPLMNRVRRVTRGRHRAAALVTVSLVLLVLVPLGLFVASLTVAATDLVDAVWKSKGGKQALEALVSGSDTLGHRFGAGDVVALAREYGDRALALVGVVAGATAKGVLGVFVFLLAAYAFLAEGPQMYEWLEAHIPITPSSFRRYTDAFSETGRGLFIGVALTAAIQGVTATVAYVLLGIPRAAVLGVLTAFASVIPSVGTALVWIPITLGLALTGSWWRAAIMALVGVFVIGLADNLLRPLLSHRGRLQLPTFVLMVAMFGGLATIGAWGLLLGPLLVRLAMEGLCIERDTRALRRPTAPLPATADKPDDPQRDNQGDGQQPALHPRRGAGQ